MTPGRGAVPCAACGGPMVAAGRAPDGALERCDDCGSRRIAVAVGAAGEPAAAAPGYGSAYRDGADGAKVSRLQRLFTAAVGPSAGRTVLDVGCGDGGFLAAVRAVGWGGLGVDIDAQAVAATAARGIPAVVGAADASAGLAATVDVATLWDLLEHVPDPRATARWLAERIAPGGRVIVLTPDAGSLFDRAGAWERRATAGRSSRLDGLCLNRYHRHRFSAAGLRRLFASVGFRCSELRRLQLFSLQPERYLAGFAPGIAGWTGLAWLDRLLSRCAYAAVERARIHNKLLYVGTRVDARTPDRAALPLAEEDQP